MKLLAVIFVVLWSTGFIVGRSIVHVADPNLFLLTRFLLSAALFSLLTVAWHQTWPARREIPKHLLAGMLLNGLYLGGTYWAIAQGLPPAMMALIGALQPLFTAALAGPLLGESVQRKVLLGLAIGLCGVALVLLPSLTASHIGRIPVSAVIVAILSITAITAGTIMQKTSIGTADLLPSSALQSLGGAIVALCLALLLGESKFVIGPVLLAALTWAVFILSGCGTFLLLWLVRRGNATNTVSLLLMAPPLAAVEAFFLFGDTLNALQIAGFAIALIGVFICAPTKKSA